MTLQEITEKAKKQFYYKSVSPYYYGLKEIKSETVKEMTAKDFFKNYEKIKQKYNKNGDLVRIDNVTVKCFYNNNNEILLIILK